MKVLVLSLKTLGGHQKFCHRWTLPWACRRESTGTMQDTHNVARRSHGQDVLRREKQPANGPWDQSAEMWALQDLKMRLLWPTVRDAAFNWPVWRKFSKVVTKDRPEPRHAKYWQHAGQLTCVRRPTRPKYTMRYIRPTRVRRCIRRCGSHG